MVVRVALADNHESRSAPQHNHVQRCKRACVCGNANGAMPWRRRMRHMAGQARPGVPMARMLRSPHGFTHAKGA